MLKKAMKFVRVILMRDKVLNKGKNNYLKNGVFIVNVMYVLKMINNLTKTVKKQMGLITKS